jgi:hypothetical protein
MFLLKEILYLLFFKSWNSIHYIRPYVYIKPSIWAETNLITNDLLFLSFELTYVNVNYDLSVLYVTTIPKNARVTLHSRPLQFQPGIISLLFLIRKKNV